MYEYMRLFVYEFALFHFNFHGKAVISCSWPSKYSIGNITNPFRFPSPHCSLPFLFVILLLLLLLAHSHWKFTFRVIWPTTKHLQNVIRQTTRCSLTNQSTNTYSHTHTPGSHFAFSHRAGASSFSFTRWLFNNSGAGTACLAARSIIPLTFRQAHILASTHTLTHTHTGTHTHLAYLVY